MKQHAIERLMGQKRIKKKYLETRVTAKVVLKKILWEDKPASGNKISNSLNLYLKELEKGKQTKPKVIREKSSRSEQK